MEKYNLIFSYFDGDRNGFENDYVFALSLIMSHHSFTAALGHRKNKTVLVTDVAGKELIVDKMGLYFDEVKLIDNAYVLKLTAIREYVMEGCLIHVDWDTYLLKTFPVRVFDTPIFCDYIQRNNPIDVEAWNECYSKFWYKDLLIEEVNSHRDSLWSIESGVLGQDKMGYWLEYCDYARYVFNQNRFFIESPENLIKLRRVLENVLPYYFFKERNREIGVLIDRNKETESEMFQHQLSNLNFIRLYGNSKRNSFLLQAIEKFVRKYYSDSYDKIVSLRND